MASHVLYPPSIDSYMPSFQVSQNGGKCLIKFSLSKFNGASDIKGVHIAVFNQKTGLSVVNDEDDTGSTILRYRNTGIIILENYNAGSPIINEIGDNLYSIELKSSDLYPSSDGFNGFIPGWLYKVQIRLSLARYTEVSSSETQAYWLKEHASDFSEWSTVCVIKPIGDIQLSFTTFNTTVLNTADTQPASVGPFTLTSSTLDFCGKLDSLYDTSEVLYSYRVRLSKGGNLLEDSGIITSENYENINEFHYLFKTELENAQTYSLEFSYETNNGFTYTQGITTIPSYTLDTLDNMYVATIENYKPNSDVMFGLSSVSIEEDEGRIGLKLVDTNISPTAFTGTLIIRRSSSRENFTIWEDIKSLTFDNTLINDLDIFYDYTVESGVWYLYGLQKVVNNNRTALAFPMDANNQPIKNPSLRNFEYSFLLGENNKQLKLKFDNTMNSYKLQMMENKTEPIGNKYPIISRNGALGYRLFPINGLISFNMDDCSLFCGKQVLYKFNDVLSLYQNYEKNRGTAQYNYIYERDFRKEVIKFLCNGKVKLFKSPTEGNILVRLTEVSFTPNQTLSRLVYSFTSNANEIADDTLDNYIKYKILDLNSIDNNGTPISIGHIHTNADSNNSPN